METPQLKTIPFAQLRQAHQKVKSFLENESLDKVQALHTKISHDLGLAGDDVEELLVKFVSENKLSGAILFLNSIFTQKVSCLRQVLQWVISSGLLLTSRCYSSG